MSRRRSITQCKRCGKDFVPILRHKAICQECRSLFGTIQEYGRTKSCPGCGTMIHPHNTTCRECRWKPFRMNHVCPTCGKPKSSDANNCNACAAIKKSGPGHPCWKGGTYHNSIGYLMVYAPGHPRVGSNGYVREHLRVWMERYGDIPVDHVIHHLNGVKDDNRLENLICISKYKHQTNTIVQMLQKRIRELEVLLSNARVGVEQ